MIKIVVSTILAIHGVVLGGLLFLGCKEEAPDTEPEQFTQSGLQTQDPVTPSDDPFVGLLPETSDPIDIPGADEDQTGNTTSMPPFPPGRNTGNTSGFEVDPGNPGLPGTQPPPADIQPTTTFPTEPVPPINIPREREPYVVQPGDHFTSIARDHGLKVADIVAANPGVDSRRLQVGDLINLPPDVPARTPKVPAPGTENEDADGLVHVVVSGDTLFGLERKYGVSVKAIQDANNLKGSKINVGKKLFIPIQKN